jgi:HAD superfamily 5'-nucleotidase-like hydrolase
VDTLFSLGETYLFCQLVELKERLTESWIGTSIVISVLVRAICITSSVLFHSHRMPSRPAETALTNKPFIDMYAEIRASVDLCHRDGSLKAAVAADPDRYIHRDDALVPMLQALKASGKKVFLLTNSLWDFTNVVMNHLVHGTRGEEKTAEWTELFDTVVTGSCKPGFFENERAAIFEVDVETR